MGNLNKVQYTDHQTVITAGNLNDIQDSIIQNTSYTTCSTGASTAAKTATLANFVLTTGSAVRVKFTNTNTATSPTLNINSTGAKEIYINETTAAGAYARTSWAAGSVVTLVYDGSHWIIVRTGDASVMAMTPIFLTENTDLDTVTTAGTYRVWGRYTNAPVTNNIYGVLTVSGIPGALIQMYQSCTATNSFFRGYTNSQWYPWKQLMINSGGIFNGTLFIDRKDGTTSTTGTSTLWLGNSTPTGTDENSKGQVVLYGNGANYINIQATNATGNRTVELPDENGTLMSNKGGTFNGEVIIDRQDGTASTEGWSGVTVGNGISKGTANNSTGYVRIFGKTGYRTDLNHQSDGMPTANRALYLPDATGTIALTSDIYNSTNISNYFTLTASGVSLNGTNVCLKVGPTIILRLNFVKTDSGNFGQGRIALGTLSSGVRPLTARYVVNAASNGINSYLNRQFGLIIQTDGAVIADNFFYSDVKQLYINIEYTKA